MAPVVLVVLQEENSYGYQIMERISDFGFEQINSGTVYRALRQLERKGLCTSRWETSEEGPGRRVYSVTNPGVAYLDAWGEKAREYHQLMDTFFRAYTVGRAPRAQEEAGHDGKAS